MQRTPVQSSDIVAVGYSPAEKLLEVEFQGGRVYQYSGVEPDIHLQFMRADSHGTFFFAHINGKYRYHKVSNSSLSTTQESQGPLTFINGTAADLQALEMACEQYSIDIETLTTPLDTVLQSEDAEEIAQKKAKLAHMATKRPVVVSVINWNILALHGFPGLYMTQVASWLQSEDFLALLATKAERTVVITHVVAYADGIRSKTFKQEQFGSITREPAGEGSAIERIVQLAGSDKTIAEQKQTGLSTWTLSDESVWNVFAKWLYMRRRFDNVA